MDTNASAAPLTPADRIALCKGEIIWLIADDVMPVTVSSFSELHDYVDANTLGAMCDTDTFPLDWPGIGSDADFAVLHEVQDAIDEWLAAGRPLLCEKCNGIAKATDGEVVAENGETGSVWFPVDSEDNEACWDCPACAHANTLRVAL